MSFRISQDAAAAVSGSPSFRAAWARRAVLCGIGALLLCWQPAPASAATIQSTTAGGYWSSAATWVGGVKPTATDIARISGPVAITSGTPTVAGLIVDASASLVGGTSSSATLIVHGNVDNQGTISNYSPTKTLIINADGDVITNLPQTYLTMGAAAAMVSAWKHVTFAASAGRRRRSCGAGRFS